MKIVMVPTYYSVIFVKFALGVLVLVSLCNEPAGGYKEQVEWCWLLW
jgi:hypothetical protein